MPRLSPSASRSACPSASAQSSTVWCSSTCEIAAAGELEREAAVARDLLEHVVEEADAGRDADRRPRRRGRRERDRWSRGCAAPRSALRGRSVKLTRDGRPAVVARRRRASRAGRGAEIACELQVAARSPMTAERARSIGAVARYSSTSRVFGLRQSQLVRRPVRADEHRVELDALRGEQRENELLRRAERRLRKARRAEAVLVGHHHEAVARVPQAQRARRSRPASAAPCRGGRPARRAAPRRACRRGR